MLTNPPASYGDGGQKGAMWMLQYEAFLSHKKLGHAIQSEFDNALPGTETEALTVGTDNEAIKAK